MEEEVGGLVTGGVVFGVCGTKGLLVLAVVVLLGVDLLLLRPGDVEGRPIVGLLGVDNVEEVEGRKEEEGEGRLDVEDRVEF